MKIVEQPRHKNYSFWKGSQLIVIGIILLFAFIINLNPFLNYDINFAPSPDTAALACGVKTISDTGKFNIDNTSYFISSCWTKTVYPLNQITTFNLHMITGLSVHTTTQLIAIVLTTLIVFSIYILSFRIFKKTEIAMLAAFFAVVSGSLTRSLILTPQNLFGYFILILIFWLAVKYKQTKNKINLFIIFFALLSLSIFHQLSFFVSTIIIFLYLLIALKGYKQKLLLILSLTIIASLMSGLFVNNFNFLNIILNRIYNASTEGYLVTDTNHPLWALPAALGYLITILGLLGFMVLWRKKNFIFYPLFLIAILIPLIFSQTYLIGFNLAPHRFLAFAWIPLCIMAPIGIFWLLGKIKYTKFNVLIYFMLPLILLGSTMQVLNYQASDMKGFGEKYLPNQDTLIALSWLNNNSSTNDTVLTTIDGKNRKSIYFPYLFQGKTISYPLYAFKSLGKFEIKDEKLKESVSDQTLEPRGIGKIVKPFVNIDNEKVLKNNKEWEKYLFDLFLMVSNPQSEEAQKLYDENSIEYFVAWRGSAENTIFSTKGASYFDKVYENNTLLIYERRANEG